jgi:hypothetical protein
MFNAAPCKPIDWAEVEAALAEAIRSSAGGQMTRSAEVFLASVCAKHLTEHLVLAGLLVMRRVNDQSPGG